MQPDTYAAVLTLTNVTGKTKSNMCSELLDAALKMPKYRELLKEADEAQTVAPKEDTRVRKGGLHRQPSATVRQEAKSYKQYLEQPAEEDIIEGMGLDKLTPERLQEMQKMLKMLELMKQMDG